MSLQEFYGEFIGLKRTVTNPDAPQIAALILDNMIPNRIAGGWIKRPGSKRWTQTGDILGFGVYSQKQTNLRNPNISWVLRHRRDGGTSYIEKYDWATDTWVAITLGANTSFNVNGIMSFSQQDGLGVFCAGRPAKISDITAGSISRLGGPAPTTAPTWGTSGTGLTGSTFGWYTFYDSTTGWESSPSPITALTTLANQGIAWSGLETTCAREGVDKKRLYRTQVGASGALPGYRVTELALATTTYADTIADASLGAQSPAFGDHDPPPSTSYICAQYEGRTWIASDSALYYSLPYDGNSYTQEYFSSSRVFYFNQRIMGLAYSPEFSALIVFLPPGQGIHTVSGRSETDFEKIVFKEGEGTNFPTSVCVFRGRVAYWGPNGLAVLTPQGVVTDFADDVKEVLRQFSTQEYDGNSYVFTIYHPIWNQLLVFLSATSITGVVWATDDGFVTVPWVDSSTGAFVSWST